LKNKKLKVYFFGPNDNDMFFEGLTTGQQEIAPLTGMQVLALFGDSVTTDHISPADQIAPPALRQPYTFLIRA